MEQAALHAGTGIVREVRDMLAWAADVKRHPIHTFYFERFGRDTEVHGSVEYLEVDSKAIVAVERRLFDHPETGEASEAFVVHGGEQLPEGCPKNLGGPYGVIIFTEAGGDRAIDFEAKAFRDNETDSAPEIVEPVLRELRNTPTN